MDNRYRAVCDFRSGFESDSNRYGSDRSQNNRHTGNFNLGAAWGMLSGARWIFIIISIAAIIILPIILYKYRKLHFLFGFSMSLIIGGAIGNIIDRLFSGNGVTDFIEFAFVDFPIFNVADICVTVGAVMMFIYLVFIDKTFFMTKDSKKEKEETKNVSSEKDDSENHE